MKQLTVLKHVFLCLTRFRLSCNPLQRCMVRVTNNNSVWKLNILVENAIHNRPCSSTLESILSNWCQAPVFSRWLAGLENRRSLVRSPGWPISLRRLKIAIVQRFVHLSQQNIVSTIVLWESSQCLGKNIVWSNSKINSRKVWMGALAFAI